MHTEALHRPLTGFKVSTSTIGGFARQEKQKNSNTGESLHIHHSEESTAITINPTVNL